MFNEKIIVGTNYYYTLVKITFLYFDVEIINR